MKALWRDALLGLRLRRAGTAVAVAGLLLALAAALLLALVGLAMADTDPRIPDPDRVVLVDVNDSPAADPGPWRTAAPVALGPLLRARGVPLADITRVAFDGLDIQHQGRLQPAFLVMADPSLAPLLGLRALHGDLATSLSRRDGIAITRSLAARLWSDLPTAQALGRTVQGRGQTFTVAAVLPDLDPRAPFPQANPLVGRAVALVGFDAAANPWPDARRQAVHTVNGRVMARLQPGAQAEQVGAWAQQAVQASAQRAALDPEARQRLDGHRYRGLPLTALPFEGELNGLRWLLLGALAAASVLLLVLAAFNTMNLQTASLLQRQRETALRRSLGASRGQLLAAWAAEQLLALLLAAGGALLLAWWAAPTVAVWLGLSPHQPVADPVPPVLLAALALAVLVLLPLTLALPAWAALRRAPAPALQGRTASEGPWGRRLRQGLLTLQLAGAGLLLTLAGVLALQQQHLLQADRGFDTRNRLWLGLMVDPEAVPDITPLMAALRQHPAVRHWAFSSARPSADTWGPTERFTSGDGPPRELRVTQVSSGFFDTYGMRLLAGSPLQGSGDGQRVVIDTKAAQLLGLGAPEAAVGALLRSRAEGQADGTERRVVAVVQAVKLESGRDPAQPQAFVLTEKPQWDITLHGPDLAALQRAVDDAWARHGPALPHETRPVDELRAEVYRVEDRVGKALAALAALAVCVALLGVYALVADTLRRRRTELVLRRLHGAGAVAIVARVAAEFAPPLLAGLLISLPLAGWLGLLFLGGYVDQVAPATGLGLPMLGAALATTLATVLAAGHHVRLALALRPAQVLD